ncbi:dihydrolipoamide acetyltransferase family protein [Nakamurella sp. GG22]
MPDAGEGLTEAEVLSWRVAVGDMLTVNQVMVEIETAKAAVELPSPFAGRVHALLVEPGVTVQVGTPIITVDTDPAAGPLETNGAAESPGNGGAAAAAQAGRPGDPGPSTTAGAKIGEVSADGRIATLVGYTSAAGSTSRRPRRGASGAALDPVVLPAPAASSVPVMQDDKDKKPTAPASLSGRAPLAAPPVRKLAKDLGVELAAVTPTRADGVISRTDVENAAAATASGSVTTSGAVGPERRIPVKGVRKLTAAAMVSSAFTAPHVTEFLTVDVTPMMELRDRLRRRPEFAEVKLTPLAFVARAVCLAARRTPEINAVFENAAEAGGQDHIVVKEYVNLGIAAATPRGLLVPVVQHADALDLAGLATALQELSATARAGTTTPAQMTGGTFSITNVGVFGVDTGTPIISPGESAILALGSIKDAPWVVDGQLAVRKVCQLALSFDHRVVDGQQGSQFLADVGALISDPGLALAF